LFLLEGGVLGLGVVAVADAVDDEGDEGERNQQAEDAEDGREDIRAEHVCRCSFSPLTIYVIGEWSPVSESIALGTQVGAFIR